MKIWLVISIVLTVLLMFSIRYLKGHQTDGDMGVNLLVFGFFILMLLNWCLLIFELVYRWLNSGGG